MRTLRDPNWAILTEVLKRVQERWPHAIYASVKVEDEYSVR
jgi:hypothetical protein